MLSQYASHFFWLVFYDLCKVTQSELGGTMIVQEKLFVFVSLRLRLSGAFSSVMNQYENK